MNCSMRLLPTAFCLLLLVACRQVVDVVNVKQLAPEIAAFGRRADAWYEYMPQYAPYFCLKTRYSLMWHDAEMNLGYWVLRHPEPPHRVVMEARGDKLLLHRGFVWDGVSFGKTVSRELVPSLLHDALYYARQGNAPVSRREADLVYLRACRRYNCGGKYLAYAGVRIFGVFFGESAGCLPPLVEQRSPEDAPASLPAGENEFILLQL